MYILSLSTLRKRAMYTRGRGRGEETLFKVCIISCVERLGGYFSHVLPQEQAFVCRGRQVVVVVGRGGMPFFYQLRFYPFGTTYSI